jgi:hypothetical protein
MTQPDENDDGPQPVAVTTSGTVARTTGVVRPIRDSQSTESLSALADAYALLHRIAARAEQLVDAA